MNMWIKSQYLLLIAYIDKMSTNNIIKLKWLKYSCFRIYNIYTHQNNSRSFNKNQMNIATKQKLNDVAQDDKQFSDAPRWEKNEENKIYVYVKITCLDWNKYKKTKRCDFGLKKIQNHLWMKKMKDNLNG